jgi:hypothetical protein
MTETVIAAVPPNDGREWENQCARCGSSVMHVECEQCGCEGVDGHDCGEDTCCCLCPEENVVCDICGGVGGWFVCMSSEEFCEANPLPGRESIGRGQIEWYPA